MNLIGKKIVNNLIKKKLTISIAESCTGGLLSAAITSVKGSSKTFILSIVAYSNLSKIKILKIPKATIKKYGAVSEKVCFDLNYSKAYAINSNIAFLKDIILYRFWNFNFQNFFFVIFKTNYFSYIMDMTRNEMTTHFISYF